MKKLLILMLVAIVACVGTANAQNYHNSHEYVDLGLPSGLKWATMNVGAYSPSEFGQYFGWGETEERYDYSSSNSRTYQRNFTSIGGNPQYDVARYRWGGNWRLPTMAEFEELLSICTWVWTRLGDHNGFLVTGPNGNQIFLPAAGYRSGTSLKYPDSGGCYWSSTPDPNRSHLAYQLELFAKRTVTYTNRSLGQSVRPVTE